MTEHLSDDLKELGLPRANSNGLLLFALVIIAVFGVMFYSCTRNRNNRAKAFESPAHALNGNEWFVGKAQGIEISEAEPTPSPAPQVEKPLRTVRAGTSAPRKRLGGKVFSANTKLSAPRREAEQSLAIDEVSSFELGARTPEDRLPRPEYYLKRDVERPISDFEVKAGVSISAQLDLGINSDLGGPAVAHVTRTVYDTSSGSFPLIPPGTKLIGRIDPSVGFGQTRVDVIWERLIFPNGASLVVENMRASDPSGELGLHHTVDNHFDTLFGGAVLLSGISAGVQLSQPQESASFGGVPSASQTMAAALGQNLGQVSTEFIRRQMDVKPTIRIPNGEHFTVTVNKDMVFPGPYGAWD